MRNSILIIGIMGMLLSACSNKEKHEFLSPNVTGKAGEVVLVMEDEKWAGATGDSLQNFIIAEFPVLPQREPYFDVIQIKHEAFSSIFRTHRNIINVDISPRNTKPSIQIKKDVWANPQIYIEIKAPDDNSFLELLSQHGDKIVKSIENKEISRIKDNYLKYEEITISKRLSEEYGIDLRIPKGYTMDVATKDFVWLTHEGRDATMGVLIYFYPYTDTTLFMQSKMLAKRDEVLKMNVPGPNEGTYMMTEQQVEPLYIRKMHNKRFTVEIKGLWRVFNYAMGGPFISYSTVDEIRNRIVTVEGFVYSPRTDKRNYIWQAEAIVSSLNFEPLEKE